MSYLFCPVSLVLSNTMTNVSRKRVWKRHVPLNMRSSVFGKAARVVTDPSGVAMTLLGLNPQTFLPETL